MPSGTLNGPRIHDDIHDRAILFCAAAECRRHSSDWLAPVKASRATTFDNRGVGESEQGGNVGWAIRTVLPR
jgi:hypothetical protein